MAGISLAVASALIFATACGGGGEQNDSGLGAGDYQMVSKDDVVNSIIVEGSIAPIRSAGISSVTGAPVQTLHVQVGDRVKKGQLLVTMDTKPAPAGGPQLQSQSDLSQSDLSGGDPLVMSPVAAGIDRVVFDISSKIEDLLKPKHGGVAPKPRPHSRAQGQPASAPAPNAPQLPQDGQLPQDAQIPQDGSLPAPGAPSREELEQVIDEAHAQGRAQGQAEAQQMLEDQMKSEQSPMGIEDYPVADPEIYSPMDGIVTKIDVEEGAVAAGTLMTVSDTSKLLVRTSVREADVSTIREGNRVTFTTPATGDTKFDGRVRKIAPMAGDGEQQLDPAAAARAMQGGGNSDSKDSGVAFPVEVEVVGKIEGLRLGGSARVEIITEEERGGLSIPRDAVFEDSKVLVLARENEDATTGTIEERRVETGVKNDTDIAVTGGDLKAGDIVLTWPEDYLGRVGETVDITDEKFGERGPGGSKDSKGGDGEKREKASGAPDDKPGEAPADAPKE